MSNLLLVAAAIVAATAAATLSSTLPDPAAPHTVAWAVETDQCQPFVPGQTSACNPFSLHWTAAQAHDAVPGAPAAPAQVAEQHR